VTSTSSKSCSEQIDTITGRHSDYSGFDKLLSDLPGEFNDFGAFLASISVAGILKDDPTKKEQPTPAHRQQGRPISAEEAIEYLKKQEKEGEK
jgi:hypothetical protein